MSASDKALEVFPPAHEVSFETREMYQAYLNTRKSFAAWLSGITSLIALLVGFGVLAEDLFPNLAAGDWFPLGMAVAAFLSTMNHISTRRKIAGLTIQLISEDRQLSDDFKKKIIEAINKAEKI